MEEAKKIPCAGCSHCTCGKQSNPLAKDGVALEERPKPPKGRFRNFCEKNLPTFTHGFDSAKKLMGH